MAQGSRWTPVKTMMTQRGLTMEETQRQVRAGLLEMTYSAEGEALVRDAPPSLPVDVDELAARVGAMEVALHGMRGGKAADAIAAVPSAKASAQRALSDLRAIDKRGGPDALEEVNHLVIAADTLGAALLAELVQEDQTTKAMALSVFARAVDVVRAADPVSDSSSSHLLSRCRHWLSSIHYVATACAAQAGLMDADRVPFGAAPLERSIIREWLRAVTPEAPAPALARVGGRVSPKGGGPGR